MSKKGRRAPRSFIPTASSPTANAGARRTGDDAQAIPFLKSFTVFNAEQCADLPEDIAPLPSPPADHLILPQAEALIRATGADIRVAGNQAFYIPSED